MRWIRRVSSLPFPAPALLSLSLAALVVARSAGESERGPEENERKRTVLVVPGGLESDWRDLAFLCAVPAAVGRDREPTPLVTVDPVEPWRPELLDFLRLYRADSILYLGGEVPDAAEALGLAIEALDFTSPAEASRRIASRFWKEATRGVVFEEEERGAALAASVLAARLGVPVFPSRDGELDEEVRALALVLGIRRMLYVVEDPVRSPGVVRKCATTRLVGAEEVVRFLRQERRPLEYLAACHPADGGPAPGAKLSLAAALLAAGRRGALVPLDLETRWKVPFAASADGEGGAPAGRVELGDDRSYPFTLAHEGRHWTARLDLDGDGAFDGEGEEPLRTGDAVELAGRRWTADLDALEAERGAKLWLTTPDRETLREELARFLEAAGGTVTHLCLAGWPQCLPSVVVSDGQGIDGDLVSDLPLADVDDDPFVELCTGRVIAEDGHAAVLYASRCLAHEALLDDSWSSSFATAEWEAVSAQAFESYGFRLAGHHPGGVPITPDSPLTRCAAIVHGSHAMWTGLGQTYAWDSGVLLAPCFVESSGCSTASLDQDAEYRSVVARLLRNGALAFVGNSRRGVAQQDYFRSEVWNGLLAGATLGEAHRRAQNALLVACLDENELDSGLHRYQLYNQAVIGDPGLRLHLPSASSVTPAHAVKRGSHVTVHPPSRWWRYEVPTLPEWKSVAENLHYLRGAGMATDNWWFPTEKRNDEAYWFTVRADAGRKRVVVEQVGKAPEPLGWTGRFFVDENADGTRTVWWRCRLVDFDVRGGEVRGEVDELVYRLR